MEKMTIERDRSAIMAEDESNESETGIRIFLRYEIDLITTSSVAIRPKWKYFYPWIASLKPIAGNIEMPHKDMFDKETPDVKMWFITRIPALPDDLNQYIKDAKHLKKVDIRMSRWSWGPAGLKDISEEDIYAMEHAFDSNLVVWAFLEDEKPELEE